MARKNTAFGFSREWHGEIAREHLQVLELKMRRAEQGSCVDRLKTMRQLDREVARVRFESVAAGDRVARVLLPRAIKFDKQLNAAWKNFHNLCMVTRK